MGHFASCEGPPACTDVLQSDEGATCSGLSCSAASALWTQRAALLVLPGLRAVRILALASSPQWGRGLNAEEWLRGRIPMNQG